MARQPLSTVNNNANHIPMATAKDKDDDDDFGLSSGDEADLIQMADQASSQPVQQGIKRKADEAGLTHSWPVAKKPCEDSTAFTVAQVVLAEQFGFLDFRLEQAAAITRLIEGDSAVVVFPTGGGKSLCYQVPALAFKEMDRLAEERQGEGESGITLVVSPLIALMKDQVDALHRRGISAAVLDSTKTKEEYLATVQSMRNGTLDILYCAPERLNNEAFVGAMANVRGGVRLLAVDEAHCISEWGHAFRPDYLKVARFAKEIQAERVVCLTATAAPKVAQDICRAFNIPNEGLFRTSTYRPNLRLLSEAHETKKTAHSSMRAFLKKHPGSTIIYVTLQKHAEELAGQLRSHGFNALHFHAGMPADEKRLTQEKFMASNDLIIAATIAFGMGIDKPNIRNVIHFDIPRSLEGYSQEIGRAGRDGLPSQCVMYLCPEDLHLRESFARGDLPSRNSVSSFLHEVFSAVPGQTPRGPAIEFSVLQQSKRFDIKPTVLNSIYAQLELRFKLLRASTPKYMSYSWKVLRDVRSDQSPVAVAIHGAAGLAKTDYHLDVERLVRSSGVDRAAAVSKLNDWRDEGRIDLTTKDVINVFMVTGDMPSSSAKKEEIVESLYRELVLREQQDLERMKEIQKLVTGHECYPKKLAAHFGDVLAEDCGQCTWCTTHQAVQEVRRNYVPWDSKAFAAVLEACPDRDDPRYLARIAFGIMSPRITAAKLTKHKVFGSMEDHSFVSLLNAFTKSCDNPRASNSKPNPPPVSNKPTKTNSKAYSSRGRGGYGSYGKRGY